MSTIHIHRVPTRVHSERDDGVRWCFLCRMRRTFVRRIHVPNDPMSYYGPHVSIRCERGHSDGDLFPGRVREWADEC